MTSRGRPSNESRIATLQSEREALLRRNGELMREVAELRAASTAPVVSELLAPIIVDRAPQAMDTAPRDRSILLLQADGGWTRARWGAVIKVDFTDGGWLAEWGDNCPIEVIITDPIGWLELPDVPK